MESSSARPAGGRPPAWSGSLALMGLAGLAITQPLLDLLGRNPEFFVAGRYSSRQIVELGAIVALVPSLVLIAVFLLARVVHRGAGAVVHAILLALLGALFGNVLVRGLGVDALAVALVATAAGAAAAVLLGRANAGRLLLQYLAVGNVLFLVAFLVLSPTSDLLGDGAGPEALGTVSVPVPPGPVVVIVFDELPLPTIMRSDGTINAERYPSFARLADRSTWFRNASSLHHKTERAVPTMLTGSFLRERVVPSYRALPRNLLSLMSTSVPVHRYEAITDLCRPGMCEDRPGQPLRQALDDSLVVFGHRALPEPLRDGLPPIDDAWGTFANALDAATGDDDGDESDPLALWHGFEGSERAPETQALRLLERGLAIDATPALHFAHVVLPHPPWFVTPSGSRLMRPMPAWHDDPDDPLSAWSGLIRYQRHSLQTGAADVALGQVIDHLDETGLWEDATVLVTADHGTSTIPPDVTREPTPNNLEEVYRVPLFVKAAGQRDAEVRDDVALTTDVLPTLIDLLDIETDWEMEGHSLLDGSEATAEPLVTPDIDGLLGVVRRHAADFPHGWDWTALAAVGEHGDLVGRSIGDLEVGAPSRLEWEPNNEEAFASLPTAENEVPQLVTGRISTPDGSQPPEVVVVVNGTIAGVTGGYEPRGERWAFSSMLGPFLVDGRNDLAAYEVVTGPAGPTLHALG